MKYVERPPIVDAIKWDGNNHTLQRIIDLCGPPVRYLGGTKDQIMIQDYPPFILNNDEWIVKHRCGKYERMTSEAFANKYEAIR